MATDPNASPARDAYAEYMRMASRISPRSADLESVVFVGVEGVGKSSLVEYLEGGRLRELSPGRKKPLVTQDEREVMFGEREVALVYVTGNPALAELANEQLQTCAVAVLVFDLGRPDETIEPLLTYADALARGRRIDGQQPGIILCANKSDQLGGGGDKRLWRNRIDPKDEWVLNFFELRFAHVQIVETQCVGEQAYNRIMKLRDVIGSLLPPLTSARTNTNPSTTRSYCSSAGTILTTRSAPTPRKPSATELLNIDESDPTSVSATSTSYEIIAMDEFGHRIPEFRSPKTPAPEPVVAAAKDWRKSAPAVMEPTTTKTNRKQRGEKCNLQ